MTAHMLFAGVPRTLVGTLMALNRSYCTPQSLGAHFTFWFSWPSSCHHNKYACWAGVQGAVCPGDRVVRRLCVFPVLGRPSPRAPARCATPAASGPLRTNKLLQQHVQSAHKRQLCPVCLGVRAPSSAIKS